MHLWMQIALGVPARLSHAIARTTGRWARRGRQHPISAEAARLEELNAAVGRLVQSMLAR